MIGRCLRCKEEWTTVDGLVAHSHRCVGSPEDLTGFLDLIRAQVSDGLVSVGVYTGPPMADGLLTAERWVGPTPIGELGRAVVDAMCQVPPGTYWLVAHAHAAQTSVYGSPAVEIADARVTVADIVTRTRVEVRQPWHGGGVRVLGAWTEEEER